MDLPRLPAIREGHRIVIQQKLDKIEEAKQKSTLTEFHAILDALTAEVATLLSLKQKILEETELEC